MNNDSNPNDRPFGSPEYAAKRSHQDALVSSENMRAAAQAAILINGGAATAVIAILAKENVSSYLLKFVPLALFGYALGVACGAMMVFCAGRALRYWGLSWREYMVDSAQKNLQDKYGADAKWWDLRMQWAFGASVACFISSSVCLAIIIFSAPHSVINCCWI
jgi:hypothetical protein